MVTNASIPDSFFDAVNSNGSDIVVTSSDGETKVVRDLVVLNIDDRVMVLRFQATLSTTVDTVFYIYYGNDSASETNSTAAYLSTIEMYCGLDEVATQAPSTFYDRTENDNDMTCVSIAISGDPANIGYAPTIDGVNDYAYAADSTSLDITSNITVMVWQRVGGVGIGTGERVFSKYRTSDAERSWMISTGATTWSEMGVYISDDGTFDSGHRKHYESSILGFETDEWHHLCFTFASDGTLELYIDGVKDTSVDKVQDDAITTIFNSAAPVVIGADGDYGAKWGLGYIDEIKILSEVLTATEIETIYNNEADTENFYYTSGVTTGDIQLAITKADGVPIALG
jgi:hypothetical protein